MTYMHNLRICFVNCGLPGDQCACFQAQMEKVCADLAASQKPLDPDLDRLWADSIEELYEQ